MSHYVVFGVEVAPFDDRDGTYYLRLPDTPANRILVAEWRIPVSYISPSQDSGRAWIQVPYTRALDWMIKDTIDALADIIYNRPGFGQLALFDEEAAHG